MKKRSFRFICLLLIFSVLTGVLGGCREEAPPTVQDPGVSLDTSPTATTPSLPPETAAPTVPSETIPTEPPTAPPDTEPPATEPPATLPNLQPPALKAKESFIYDTRTGQFVYASTDIDTALYPASITKLFTAYVALQFLDPTESVTVGKEVALVAYDASKAGLEKGQTWTVEGLLYCALLPSGCDASYTLAIAAGRKILVDPKASIEDSLKAFMVQCNMLAMELGMENTNFVTPDGYHHKNHYISIMAYPIIAQCILEDEVLSDIVKTPSTTVTYANMAGRKCKTKMWNTNKILRSGFHDLYRSEAIGLKTGSTKPAGNCLLSAFAVDGGYIIIGVFGCAEKNDRFSDTNILFDYYMENTPD